MVTTFSQWNRLLDLIALHEGFRDHPYDDATGKRVKAPKGFLTVGYGRNLDAHPWTRDEAISWLDEHATVVSNNLKVALPWTEDLDFVRHAALLDMAYNMGLAGLLKFKATLRKFEAGDYRGAAANARRSKWSRQTGSRAVRITRMIESGEWPDDVPAYDAS